jgi:DNA-binding MurR/RpiR family transcriptional regulator
MDRIKEKFPTMSKGQKLIAEYLLKNYEKAAFLTASKLGSIVGVSESTVVRFATLIGYDGYPELQHELQVMVEDKLSTVTRLNSASLQDAENILAQVLKSDIKDIEETLEDISQEAFTAAVDQIIKANNIYVLGNRSASALSMFLGFYLNLVLDNVKIVTNTMGDMFENLMDVDQRDVVIAISFPRYTRRTVELLEMASSQGAQIIVITDSIISPLAQIADVTLVAKSQLSSFVDTMVAPLSVINALITAVGMIKADTVKDTFKRLELVWDKYQVYYK